MKFVKIHKFGVFSGTWKYREFCNKSYTNRKISPRMSFGHQNWHHEMNIKGIGAPKMAGNGPKWCSHAPKSWKLANFSCMPAAFLKFCMVLDIGIFFAEHILDWQYLVIWWNARKPANSSFSDFSLKWVKTIFWLIFLGFFPISKMLIYGLKVETFVS